MEDDEGEHTVLPQLVRLVVLMTKHPQDPHPQEWIAERTLREGARRKRMTVRMAKPYEVAASEWVCHIEIRRGRTGTAQDVRGSDAFQAMILALKAIRQQIDELEQPVTWEEGELGYTGFPLYVPDVYGLDFTRRLERLVTAEAERFGPEQMRRDPH